MLPNSDRFKGYSYVDRSKAITEMIGATTLVIVHFLHWSSHMLRLVRFLSFGLNLDKS